jgi:O-antigen/teichoic acid export membrane protein
LRALLGFGGQVQVTNVMLMLNDQVDRSLIAYAFGPALLGLFALATLPAYAVRGASFALLSGLLPAASSIAADNDPARLRALVLRATRYIALADFALIAGVGVLAQPIIHTWLGPGYGRVAWTLVLILCGYVLWLPDQVIVHALYAVGLPGVRTRADLAFLLIHAPLSAFLTWKYGYFGTVVGTGVALTLTRLYVYWAGAPTLGIRLGYLFRFGFLRPTVAALAALTPTVVLLRLWLPAGAPALALGGTVFCLVYFTLAYRWAFDDYDRDLLLTRVVPVFQSALGRQ